MPAEHIDTLIKILSMVAAGAVALWKIGTYFADLRADIRALGEKLTATSVHVGELSAHVGDLSVRVARLEGHEDRR